MINHLHNLKSLVPYYLSFLKLFKTVCSKSNYLPNLSNYLYTLHFYYTFYISNPAFI